MPLKHKKESFPMNLQDHKLAVLYWHLQSLVHTEPRMRSYLSVLSRILKARDIRYDALNEVGFEVVGDSR